MTKERYPVIEINQFAEAKQDDLLISRFAPYLAIHQNLQQAHKHTFYHLLLFTKGGGSHTIDFEQFPVNRYQIYFMVPGQVHQWRFEGIVDGFVVNFSPAFFQSFLLKTDYPEQFSFFSGNASDGVVEIPVDDQPTVLALFEKLIKENEEPQQGTIDMVRVLLLQLFIIVGRVSGIATPKQAGPYNLTLLRNFRQLIEKNYLTLRLPKEYAALLYITPNHLNALCNDLLGISAGEVIRDRIILEAKRLLVGRDLAITEIANKLNFSDNSYFTKFFKKQAGITPEEFRKQLDNHENTKLN
jgi:AraC family transcriptional regulator, transcriptional activator of pobA